MTHNMDRRTLLGLSATVLGGTLTGCLENAPTRDESTETQGDDHTDTDMTSSANGDDNSNVTESTDSPSSDDGSNGASAIGETSFEVLGTPNVAEETATVTFDDGTVTVSGMIMGNNACYTARLDDTTIEDGTLVVSVESYEDAAEDEGCATVVIFIEYEAIVEMQGALPASVRVEHNGEQVTSVQSP